MTKYLHQKTILKHTLNYVEHTLTLHMFSFYYIKRRSMSLTLYGSNVIFDSLTHKVLRHSFMIWVAFFLKPPTISLNSTTLQNASSMLIFCILHCTKCRLNPMTVVTEYHKTTFRSQGHLVSLKPSWSDLYRGGVTLSAIYYLLKEIWQLIWYWPVSVSSVKRQHHCSIVLSKCTNWAV